MSVLVAFNAGDFLLFGADGRETAPDNTFSDSKEKLRQIPLGLIGSSGSVGFADLVSYMMSRTTHAADLYSFIQRAFADLTRNATPELREHVYRTTAWLFSHRANGALILSASHSSHDHVIQNIPQNEFAFLPPQGMTDADATGLTVFLRDKTNELCVGGQPRSARLERFAFLVQFVVEQCADKSPTVGRTFQLGVHMPDGVVQLSELMSSIHECRWRAAVRDCN